MCITSSPNLMCEITTIHYAHLFYGLTLECALWAGLSLLYYVWRPNWEDLNYCGLALSESCFSPMSALNGDDLRSVPHWVSFRALIQSAIVCLDFQHHGKCSKTDHPGSVQRGKVIKPPGASRGLYSAALTGLPLVKAVTKPPRFIGRGHRHPPSNGRNNKYLRPCFKSV
jgi:hypothetical protein